MSRVRKLISELAAEEEQLGERLFLAPCLPGGRIRVRIGGLVRSYAPSPPDWEGWGIFRPRDLETAELADEPTLPQVARYLRLLPPLRLRLCARLERRSWLAYPANDSDARQRGFGAEPVALHLVEGGVDLERVIARWDGAAWWFEQLDRREDPRVAERLRAALSEGAGHEELRWSGLTPEMRIAYQLAYQSSAAYAEQRRRTQERRRLEQALRTGGGQLRDYRDRGDYWQVDWTASDGRRHSSAIAKRDLTVMSSGICLDGRDRDFDLQSLVGVMEGAGAWEDYW